MSALVRKGLIFPSLALFRVVIDRTPRRLGIVEVVVVFTSMPLHHIYVSTMTLAVSIHTINAFNTPNHSITSIASLWGFKGLVYANTIYSCSYVYGIRWLVRFVFTIIYAAYRAGDTYRGGVSCCIPIGRQLETLILLQYGHFHVLFLCVLI